MLPVWGILAILLVIVLVVAAFGLYVYPIQTVLVIGGLIALIALWQVNNANNAKEEKARVAKVAVTVTHNVVSCSEKYPLRIHIKNNSSKTVEKVTWVNAAHAPGRSSNLVVSWDSDSSSDRILQPYKSVTLCGRVPKLTRKENPASLIWTARTTRVEQ
jgi:hypothetical protein